MSEQFIRRRRRRTDFADTSSSDRPDLPNPIESSEYGIEQNKNDSPFKPEMSSPSSTINNNDINTIRAELLEDTHHSDFAESDYFDDTHDWGWVGITHKFLMITGTSLVDTNSTFLVLSSLLV
jgi:hypothetical protein